MGDKSSSTSNHSWPGHLFHSSQAYLSIFASLHWATRCDVLHFLHSSSTNCGFLEMPPLLRQGRRVNKVLLSIMVSPPINERVLTLSNGDLADKIWLPGPLVKQNWLHQVKLFSKERTSQLWYPRWSMRVVTLRYPVTMLQPFIWSGMDQRQHGELVTLVLKRYGCIRCPGRGDKFTYQPTSEMAADSLTIGLRASRLPQIKEDLCLVED